MGGRGRAAAQRRTSGSGDSAILGIGLIGYCQAGEVPGVWQDLPYEYEVHFLSRLPLSCRNHQPSGLTVSLLQPELAERDLILSAQGVVVSYETVREWGLRFGR